VTCGDPARHEALKVQEFLKLVRIGFLHSELPVSRSLRGRIPERAWKRIARERGIWTRATASDLDVFDWIALFALVHHLDDR